MAVLYLYCMLMPQRITSPLSDGSLIGLLYYCDLYIGNSTRKCSQPKLLKVVFNLMNTHTRFLLC